MKKMMCLLFAVLILCSGSLAEDRYDVEAAIETLKACWRDEVYAFAPEKNEGYLEIKNTRLVLIREELTEDDEIAQELFGNVECIVEFVLFSDLLDLAPYYQPADSWQCVLIRRDGTMETAVQHPFDQYSSRTYSFDFSNIIEDVLDLNQTHNGVFRLSEE